MPMDKKAILRAAADNLRKELRAHSGKKLFGEEPAPPPEETVEPDEMKKAKK